MLRKGITGAGVTGAFDGLPVGTFVGGSVIFVGEAVGPPVGLAEIGAELGPFDGLPVGALVGTRGLEVGDLVGPSVTGVGLGPFEGAAVGAVVGRTGLEVGPLEGPVVGELVGLMGLDVGGGVEITGLDVGASMGDVVGLDEGDLLGEDVGPSVGVLEGDLVGDANGEPVGCFVGESVGGPGGNPKQAQGVGAFVGSCVGGGLGGDAAGTHPVPPTHRQGAFGPDSGQSFFFAAVHGSCSSRRPKRFTAAPPTPPPQEHSLVSKHCRPTSSEQYPAPALDGEFVGGGVTGGVGGAVVGVDVGRGTQPVPWSQRQTSSGQDFLFCWYCEARQSTTAWRERPSGRVASPRRPSRRWGSFVADAAAAASRPRMKDEEAAASTTGKDEGRSAPGAARSWIRAAYRPTLKKIMAVEG